MVRSYEEQRDREGLYQKGLMAAGGLLIVGGTVAIVRKARRKPTETETPQSEATAAAG
ncbi:hypothetical protein [Micromonospora sp. NPDC049679]|uniref:hypothetical protein n=1 Tax=Micromonospora sp. NPDC049679 TaxID=3155920 RepID=UPI0033EE9C99